LSTCIQPESEEEREEENKVQSTQENEPENTQVLQVIESPKDKTSCTECVSSKTEQLESLYSALRIHNNSDEEQSSESSNVSKEKDLTSEKNRILDLLTLTLSLPPFPPMTIIFRQQEQNFPFKLSLDNFYVERQIVSEGDFEERPKQVQWTCRKKELLLERKQRKQRQVYTLRLLGLELYLRPLTGFDWSKLGCVGTSVIIPSLNVLEVFFDALIELNRHRSAEEVVHTVILKSTFSRITRQKRKLLKLAILDPYSPVLFFPDSVLDDSSISLRTTSEQFISYEREIRAARVLLTMKTLDCFILSLDEKETVAGDSSMCTIADHLYLSSILSYAKQQVGNSKFLEMISSLYDAFQAENIWHREEEAKTQLSSYPEDDEIEDQDVVDAEESSIRTAVGIFRVERNRKIARVSNVVVSNEHFGKAIHGDKVMIEVSTVNGRSQGKVVSVLERRTDSFVASYFERDATEESNSREENNETVPSQRLGQLFAPMDQRLPLCIVFGRNLEKYRNQRVVLRFRSWKRHEKYPEAYLIETLGDVGDIEAETRALLTTCGVRDFEYPQHAFVEIGLPTSSFPPSVCMEKRLDIRKSRLVFSIDPPGSQDIDDALSLYPIKDNIYEVGVHIADFAAWVPSGSFIDVEAMKRGTSVYLVDRRISMIPPLLSENLCSLRQNQDRLSISVFFFVDFANQGQLVDVAEEYLDEEFVRKTVKSSADKGVYFARCILNSCGELHYNEVDSCLKGEKTSLGTISHDSQVIHNIRILADIAKLFRQKRIQAGAITNLSSEELRFQLDEEKRIQQVTTKVELEIMSVVAELMIATNAFVASHLLAVCPNDALLRRHDAPPMEKISQFMSTAVSLDFLGIRSEQLQTDQQSASFSTESFISSLEEQLDAASRDNSPWGKLISSLATRAMSEAEYFAASSGKDTRHFALGLDAYTHFTSPIRRYPDVIVHRALLRATGLEESNKDSLPPEYPGGLEELAEHFNSRHREAKLASEMSNTLFFSLYFRSQPGLVTDALIVAIQEQPLFGLSVFLPRFSLYGFVPLIDAKSQKVILPATNAQFYRKEEGDETFVKEEDCGILQPECSLRLSESGKELLCEDENHQILAGWQSGGTVKVGVWASSNRYREPGVKMLLASRECLQSTMSRTEKEEVAKKKNFSALQYNRKTKPKEQVVQHVLSDQADKAAQSVEEAQVSSLNSHRGLFRIWNIRDRDSLKRNSIYYAMTQRLDAIQRKMRASHTFRSDILLGISQQQP